MPRVQVYCCLMSLTYEIGIFQRVMDGKHLRLLYLLKGEKVTRPIWHFGDQVEGAAERYFDQYYDDIDNYRRSEVITDIYLRQPSWLR